MTRATWWATRHPAAPSRCASSPSRAERATITSALPLPDEVASAPVDLPPGRVVDLAAGPTFVRDAAGPPGAPTVFLLHGWMATADLNWFRSYAALARHFRVVAIDHRGHGRGLRTRSMFRLEDCADDVAEVATALQLDPFIPVGYSMGGPIAQLVWQRHRDQVAGLVLCATSRNFRGKPVERMAFSMLAGVALAARATPAPVRRRMHRQLARRRHDDSPVGRWARAEFRRSDMRLLMEAGRALGSFSSADWIGEVDVPTSVVITGRDDLVSPSRQQKLADAIDGATIHWVDGDHLVCAAPDAATRFVAPLLDACLDVAGRTGH